jgi:hypothetical protein
MAGTYSSNISRQGMVASHGSHRLAMAFQFGQLFAAQFAGETATTGK